VYGMAHAGLGPARRPSLACRAAVRLSVSARAVAPRPRPAVLSSRSRAVPPIHRRDGGLPSVGAPSCALAARGKWAWHEQDSYFLWSLWRVVVALLSSALVFQCLTLCCSGVSWCREDNRHSALWVGVQPDLEPQPLRSIRSGSGRACPA
jgi:hypothetical protein